MFGGEKQGAESDATSCRRMASLSTADYTGRPAPADTTADHTGRPASADTSANCTGHPASAVGGNCCRIPVLIALGRAGSCSAARGASLSLMRRATDTWRRCPRPTAPPTRHQPTPRPTAPATRHRGRHRTLADRHRKLHHPTPIRLCRVQSAGPTKQLGHTRRPPSRPGPAELTDDGEKPSAETGFACSGRYWLLRRFAPPRLRSCTCDSTSTLWMKP